MTSYLYPPAPKNQQKFLNQREEKENQGDSQGHLNLSQFRGPSCNPIELATSVMKAESSAEVSISISDMSVEVKVKFPPDASDVAHPRL
ncbi:hypothetical protein V6N13_140218 [Hibiscus sabdariffa]